MKHYSVLIREKDGKLLGRLTPDGTAVKRNIYAAMFTKEQADFISDEINEKGAYLAKAIKF